MALKPKKRNPNKALKTNAWKAISAYVRKRDKWCVTCKDNPAENCGHYRHNSERNQELGGNALWYDERNLNGQCVSCNKYNSGALDKYAVFLEEEYGHGILQEIVKLYHTPRKWTKEEILGITIRYKQLLKEIS